jgi:hypothetical protein
MPIHRTPIFAVTAVVALAACGQSGPAQAAKPWAKEDACRWWLSDADGKSLRASIEQSSDGLVLTVSDDAFRTWSELETPKVELRFDRDPKRRATLEGWVSLGGGTVGMFGLYLDATARKAMGEATTLELFRDGKLVVTLPLAATPTAAELEACVPPPSTGSSDSE